VSKKNPPPLKFSNIFFPNSLEFLVQILHAYYMFRSTLDYNFLLELTATLTKLCHIKEDLQNSSRFAGFPGYVDTQHKKAATQTDRHTHRKTKRQSQRDVNRPKTPSVHGTADTQVVGRYLAS